MKGLYGGARYKEEATVDLGLWNNTRIKCADATYIPSTTYAANTISMV